MFSESTPARGILSTSLMGRVWLPFALGIMLSYVYRAVGATIAPHLTAELGLTAGDLGLLTSTYFLGFTLTQLPAGVLLDRFGPRRVQGGILAVAVVGALIFSMAGGWAGLFAGRFLIGVGVGVALMACFKAGVDWFPADRLTALNALSLVAGGIGNIAATAPAGAFVAAHGWRTAHLALAAATAAVALAILLIVPERTRTGPTDSVAEQCRGMGRVLIAPAFWRAAPHAFLIHGGGFVAVQGLWLGPWLHDVVRLDAATTNLNLMVAAMAVVVGYMVGFVADRLGRLGISVPTVVAGVSTLFLGAEVWLAHAGPGSGTAAMLAFGLTAPAGTLNYAVLSKAFPKAMAGRVNTALNLIVFSGAFLSQWALGMVIDLWPRAEAGGYPPEAYRAAFLSLAALQAPAVVWLGFAERLWPRFSLAPAPVQAPTDSAS